MFLFFTTTVGVGKGNTTSKDRDGDISLLYLLARDRFPRQ